MRWSHTNFLALTVVLISCALRGSCAPVGKSSSHSSSQPPSHSSSQPSSSHGSHQPSQPATRSTPGAFNEAHHFNIDNVNIQTSQPPGPGHRHVSTRVETHIGPSVGLGGQDRHGNGASQFSAFSTRVDVNHKWKPDGQSSSSGSSSSSSPGSGQVAFHGASNFHMDSVEIRDHHYVSGQGRPLPPGTSRQLPPNHPVPPAPEMHPVNLPHASPVRMPTPQLHSGNTPPPAPHMRPVQLPPVPKTPPHQRLGSEQWAFMPHAPNAYSASSPPPAGYRSLPAYPNGHHVLVPEAQVPPHLQ